MKDKECRFCTTTLKHTFCDLGLTPLSNSYLTKEELKGEELVFPLHAYVCHNCCLVQLEEFQSPQKIFSEYAYFSSYSQSWLKHAENYVHMITNRYQLNANSYVIEIASNDGYLLQYFKNKQIPVLGIEPAANVAQTAVKAGIPTLVDFFGVRTAKQLAEEGKYADLLLGNNVLAHVPNINDFVEGMKIILKPQGVITMEFPHLMKLMQENQFDTIYHEHFSYLSLMAAEKVFKAHDLVIFDVETLPTHGGSLRIYAKHTNDTSKPMTNRLKALQTEELELQLDRLSTYLTFQPQVEEIKNNLIAFLDEAHKQNKKIIGYGAPAKGNTLLNFCNITTDQIDYTVDRNDYKQNRYLPGSKIPIKHPDEIAKTKPDFLLILPWNLKDEIIEQMSFIREWGGKFVVPIPNLEVIS